MAQRMDGEISAFEFSVIKDCFRRMVSEGLPEHEWVAAVENPLAALTGLNKADPELIAGMYPWRKAEELKRRLIDRDRLDRADRASRQILHFKRGQDHPIEGTEGRFSGIAFGWHAYCSEVRSSQKEVAALTIPNCQSYGTSRPRRHSLAALAPFSALRRPCPPAKPAGFFVVRESRGAGRARAPFRMAPAAYNSKLCQPECVAVADLSIKWRPFAKGDLSATNASSARPDRGRRQWKGTYVPPQPVLVVPFKRLVILLLLPHNLV